MLENNKFILGIFYVYFILTWIATRSRRFYFLNILISECNDKSLYCKYTSLKFKSALIKVYTFFMYTSSFNLITFSSFENIFSSVVNRSLILFSNVFISYTFMQIYLSDTYTYKVCLTSRLFANKRENMFSSNQYLSSNEYH